MNRRVSIIVAWQLLLATTSFSQKEPVDLFGPPKLPPPPPGLEEKLRKPYADILTPYESLRDHPCAKGKSVEEVDKQWGRGDRRVEEMLAKVKPNPDPPSAYFSMAEAVRYLNKQFQEQKLPFRIWVRASPWRGYQDLEEYYKHFLAQEVGLKSKFYIDHPSVSLLTMLMTLHDARSWNYYVFENGDIVFSQ